MKRKSVLRFLFLSIVIFAMLFITAVPMVAETESTESFTIQMFQPVSHVDFVQGISIIMYLRNNGKLIALSEKGVSPKGFTDYYNVVSFAGIQKEAYFNTRQLVFMLAKMGARVKKSFISGGAEFGLKLPINYGPQDLKLNYYTA